MATTLVNMRILESRLNNVVTAMKDLLDTGDCLWPHRLLLSTINLGVVTGFRTFLKSKTGSASRARNPGNSSGPGGSASGEGGERGNGPHNGAPGGPHQPDSNPNAHSFQLPPSDGAWLPDRTRTTGSACDTSTCTKEGADIDVQSSPGESTPVEDRDFTTEVGGGGEGQCEIGARAVEEEGVGDNSALLEGPGMPVADVSADEGETSEAETEKASPVPEVGESDNNCRAPVSVFSRLRIRVSFQKSFRDERRIAHLPSG